MSRIFCVNCVSSSGTRAGATYQKSPRLGALVSSCSHGADTDGKQELAGVGHEPGRELLVFGNPEMMVELRSDLGAGLALHRRRVGGELSVHNELAMSSRRLFETLRGKVKPGRARNRGR